MINIFDKKGFNTSNKDDDNTVNIAVSDTINHDNAMDLYSLEKKLLCVYGPYSAINIRKDENSKTLIMSITTNRNGTPEVTDFLSCEYTSKDNQNEIDKMMQILSGDLQKSKNKGIKQFIVPQTGLDLYAYIKNRPAIEIDMDDLAEEIKNNDDKKIRTKFIKNIQTGKRVNIFIAEDCLYNKIAYEILKNAYSKYSNVHFYEIAPKTYADTINWQDNEIELSLNPTPNAMNIGIGIYGIQPHHTLSIVHNKNKSVISQVAALVMTPLNAREELLEAQATGNAKSMLKVGQKRSLSIEVIEKAIKDMAREAALYKYDEYTLNNFENMAQNSKHIENGLCIVKLPFYDTTVIKNYFTEAETGLLTIINNKNLYYFGESETVHLLYDEYGWASNEEGIAYRPFENREAIYALSDMTTKREFIRTVNAAIVNRGSLKQAYDAISKISKKFKDSMGIDMDEQINLLKYVDSIKNDEAKLKSIHRIITEALTPRSPFKTFGELFDHSFFK